MKIYDIHLLLCELCEYAESQIYTNKSSNLMFYVNSDTEMILDEDVVTLCSSGNKICLRVDKEFASKLLSMDKKI